MPYTLNDMRRITDSQNSTERAWVNWAIGQLTAESCRTADTHIHKLEHERIPTGIDLYVKDESAHSTGSLKHRLARSLVLFGICNGDIKPNTPLIEASSGSTAVSEAYFAQMLGLPFYAVMPAKTATEKQRLIEEAGGTCVLVDNGSQIYARAEQLAKDEGGHYLDQFTNAERATDWRGNNNIAESVFNQLKQEPHPIPEWFVVGAGTGGTSTTLARYTRLQQHETKLCIADVENSAFSYAYEDHEPPSDLPGSRIEGIGRPRIEPSFMPELIDRIIQVPDAASIAAMRWTSRLLGKNVGGSTGTNVWTSLLIADELASQGRSGSILTLICDDGNRYLDTYYSDDWVNSQNMDLNYYNNFLKA